MEEPGVLGEGSRNSVWWNIVYKWDKIRNQVGEARGEDAKGSIWGPEMSKGAVEIHPGCSQRRVFLLVML